ncbi:hypothetical protein PGTUg99_000038, partial [Puccinia graminis f. sp. tritici]
MTKLHKCDSGTQEGLHHGKSSAPPPTPPTQPIPLFIIGASPLSCPRLTSPQTDSPALRSMLKAHPTQTAPKQFISNSGAMTTLYLMCTIRASPQSNSRLTNCSLDSRLKHPGRPAMTRAKLTQHTTNNSPELETHQYRAHQTRSSTTGQNYAVNHTTRPYQHPINHTTDLYLMPQPHHALTI